MYKLRNHITTCNETLSGEFQMNSDWRDAWNAGKFLKSKENLSFCCCFEKRNHLNIGLFSLNSFMLLHEQQGNICMYVI
jgi:hypothetical protein